MAAYIALDFANLVILLKHFSTGSLYGIIRPALAKHPFFTASLAPFSVFPKTCFSKNTMSWSKHVYRVWGKNVYHLLVCFSCILQSGKVIGDECGKNVSQLYKHRNGNAVMKNTFLPYNRKVFFIRSFSDTCIPSVCSNRTPVQTRSRSSSRRHT